MKGSRKRIINMALILGTLAVVLVIGISDNSIGEAWEAVKRMSLAWVILAVVCYCCYLMMDAVAIHFFLKRQGYRVSFLRLCFISVVGQYYSNITPGTSGGQPMQIYYLYQDRVPTAIATSAIAMRFFCFQFMLSFFAALFWILFGGFINEHVGAQKWILIVGFCYNAVMVTLVTSLALCTPMIKKLIAFAVKIAAKFHWVKKPHELSEKANQAVEVFHDSLTSYSKRPWDMLVQLIIGGLQLIALMSVIYCIYRGLGLVEESYIHLVALHVMEFISAAYAPLPGASGASEGVFSMYFGKIFPDGYSFAALLLWRFFTYYISLIIGVVVVMIQGVREGKTFKEVTREGDQVLEASSKKES